MKNMIDNLTKVHLVKLTVRRDCDVRLELVKKLGKGQSTTSSVRSSHL